MGGEDVADLRAYTNVLSRYAPGDDMPVRYLRDGTESEAILTLVAR